MGVSFRWVAPRAHPHGLRGALCSLSLFRKRNRILPCWEASFAREGFARLHKERVCPWEQVLGGRCLKTSAGNFRHPGLNRTACDGQLASPAASWIRSPCTLSVPALPLPGQVATPRGGPEPWPKRQPGKAPTGWYLVPRGGE